MKEVYLYRCQICKIAVFADSNKGCVWYVVSCAGCRVGQFYERIVIAQGTNMYKESYFLIKEKEDGDTDSDTSKEG